MLREYGSKTWVGPGYVVGYLVLFSRKCNRKQEPLAEIKDGTAGNMKGRMCWTFGKARGERWRHAFSAREEASPAGKLELVTPHGVYCSRMAVYAQARQQNLPKRKLA